MSYSQALIRFNESSAMLRSAMRQMEIDLQEFNRLSEEKWQAWRDKMQQSRSEWPQIIQNFKAALNELPKELRKRDIVKTAVKELEYYEMTAKGFFNSCFGESNIDNWSLRWDSVKASVLETIHEKNLRFNQKLAELDSHPLMDKLRRGEIILASRAKIQWNRKLGHMAFGLFFLWFFEYSPLTPAMKWSIYAFFVAACFTLEYLRHQSEKINAWVCRFFRPVMRECEKDKINSSIFFIASMSLVYFIFPRDVAALTMLFIAIGDPVAGIIGVNFGKHKISQHASIEGTLACFAACALLAIFAVKCIFLTYTMPDWELTLFAIYSGAVGALAEGSFKKWDDNLVMPLISAPLLTLFLSML